MMRFSALSAILTASGASAQLSAGPKRRLPDKARDAAAKKETEAFPARLLKEVESMSMSMSMIEFGEIPKPRGKSGKGNKPGSGKSGKCAGSSKSSKSAKSASSPGSDNFVLTILHNNDAESSLIDYDGNEGFGGAALFKTVVDDLKKEAVMTAEGQEEVNRGVIMVSSGDNFVAGPQFTASLDKGVPYYDATALDMIGYDAVCIGNHDFDFGPDVLANFIDGQLYTLTRPPYLSANLDFSGEPVLQDLFNKGRIASSVVVEESCEEIGIIGAITPDLAKISSPRDVRVLGISESVSAVQAEVDKLEAMGVNKIILISNLQGIEEERAVVPLLRGIDVYVRGGGGDLLSNPGDLLVPGDEEDIIGFYPEVYYSDADGEPVIRVTTLGQYGYVGRLVVTFDEQGKVIDVGDASGPIRVAGEGCGGSSPCDDAVAPDPAVQEDVVDPVIAFLASLESNVVGVSEVDLDGRRGSVRSMETNEGNLIADALLWRARALAPDFGVPAPDVALQNGGGIRNDDILPAGDVTELDTFDILPFNNFIAVLPGIPRGQFKEIIENAVSRTQPGDSPGGTGRFAQIAGFNFVWDPAGTAQVLDGDGNVITPGTRVRTIQLANGVDYIVTSGAVVAGPDVTVATISFLARGGDSYPFRGAAFKLLGATDQRALKDFIEDELSGLITAASYPEGGDGRIFEDR